MSHRTPRGAMRGFSLVEIMVAVVVICVGLLGIAKMQALAVSSTTTARLRAMAAFQAASLASIMHSNRLYWASATAVANSPVTIQGLAVTPAALVQAANACEVTTVSAVPKCPGTLGALQLAGYDLARWASALTGLLPNLRTTITCQGAVQPASCIIQMQWTEQTGTINSAENSVAIVDPAINAAGNNLDYYTLYVEP
jgi:type IV pilus assembly protein PilV